MLHTEFAERAARRLEAVADRLEEQGRWLKLDTTSARAKELRVAAHLVRNEAAAVTQEEENLRGRTRRPIRHGSSHREDQDWREAERYRRMRLYYELGGEHAEEEWLVNPTLETNRYHLWPFGNSLFGRAGVLVEVPVPSVSTRTLGEGTGK